MADDILFDADGAPGQGGHHGSRGSDGRTGRDGSPGEGAGGSRRGQHGGDNLLTLASAATRPDLPLDAMVVTGQTAKTGVAARPIDVRVRAASLGWIVVSARGGHGGAGGHGGDGGRGGDGHDGSDATRHSRGTDGGPGGDGGDGGPGTDGSPGGDGGRTEIRVHERDLFLLMAVAHAEAPDGAHRGGDGGRAGAHGVGGAGGRGGSGGSSYSWSETEYRSETRTNAQGNTETVTVPYTTSHHNPGGSNGAGGSRGWTPTTPLHDGRRGASGVFGILVADEAGKVAAFARRYDLEIVDFGLFESDTKDVDGIFEFGEVVHVAKVRLRNTGGMPTPPRQRVRLYTLRGQWARPLGDELYLAESVPPGGEIELQGSMRFQIPLALVDAPGEPFIAEEAMGLDALQLGLESGEASGKATPFQRRYAGTSLRRMLRAQFPIENRSGIVALRSLAEGERTHVSIDVANVSQKPIGERSVRARKVGVQIELMAGDVLPENVVLTDPVGREIDLGSQEEGFSGGFRRVPEIAARGVAHVRMAFGFRRGLAPYVGAQLRVTLWIEDLFDPAKWRIVQRREVTIRLEPDYVYHDESKVLLVTNNNTTERGFLAYRSLLEEKLGLKADFWSVSRYGHLDFRRDLPDGTDLRTHLEDRMVLILNQKFQPRSKGEKDLPTDYLRARDFRDGTTRKNTHFAILGSQDFSLVDLLGPTTDLRTGGDDFPDAKSFLAREARSPGTFTEEIFKEDIMAHVDVVPLTGYTWPLQRPWSDARLTKKARALQGRLVKMHPNRRYVLVTRPLSDPVKEGHFLFFPRWKLGHVEVRRSLNVETGSATVLHVKSAGLNDPRFIFDFEARFVILLSLPFEDKLDRLDWLLATLPDALDVDRERTARAIVLAIMIDLGEEQSALRRSNAALTDASLRERLSNFERLVERPFHTQISVGSNKWDHLVELCAGIRASAAAHRAWWKPFGRDRRISRYVDERLVLLESRLFDAYAVDPEGDVAMESQTAKARIEGRVKALLVDFRELRMEARGTGTKISLGEAARRHFTHPTDLVHPMIRDIDLFLDPAERVLDATELRKAQRAEARREKKQEELRALNARVRASMLTEAPAQASSGEPEETMDLRDDELLTEPLFERA